MAQVAPRLTLAEELLLAVGEGRTTVATAARLAAARVGERSADALCHGLAACNDKNGERTLHHMVGKTAWRQLIPEAYHFQAPLRKLGTKVAGNLYCLLPHVLFAQLARRARPVFDQLFGRRPSAWTSWASSKGLAVRSLRVQEGACTASGCGIIQYLRVLRLRCACRLVCMATEGKCTQGRR